MSLGEREKCSAEQHRPGNECNEVQLASNPRQGISGQCEPAKRSRSPAGSDHHTLAMFIATKSYAS
jgi:hypothetical protein